MKPYNKSYIPKNIINIPRHFAPAVREWSDSMYSYNGKNIQQSIQNNKTLRSFLAMYLHLIPKSDEVSLRRLNKDGKYYRRPNSRRLTTKQLFLSNPYIKQSSDKLNITIFTFDREKGINNKKLFFLNKELKNNVETLLNGIKKPTKSLRLENIKSNKTSVKALSKKYDTNYNVFSKGISTYILSIKNKVNYIYMYGFLKWSLSAFNYNTVIIKKGEVVSTYSTHSYSDNIKSFESKHSMVFILKGKAYVNVFSNNTNVNCINIDNIIQIVYLGNKEYNNKMSNLNIKYINNILASLLIFILNSKLNNTQINTSLKIKDMLNYYHNKFMFTFINKYLQEQKSIYKHLYKLYINKVKYNNLILGAKLLISNIYNKKTTLNLINLKYLHLNSDILINAISTKLKDKKSKLTRVFNKALKLVKLPYLVYNTKLFVDLNNTNNFKSYSLYNVVNNNNNNVSNDNLHILLNEIYPYKTIDFVSNGHLSSIRNILNSIQYKWTTGIRLEGRGRLTKRFMASRSVFKYRYKGSLTNLEYLNMPGHRKELTNTITLRNQVKPNVQYSFASNSRNIGVYGIKGWISNK